MVDVDGDKLRAKIAHKGRGKFRIEDDVDGHHKGKIIDASDIISCNVDRMLSQNNSAWSVFQVLVCHPGMGVLVMRCKRFHGGKSRSAFVAGVSRHG
jgi:hypothetical protein